MIILEFFRIVFICAKYQVVSSFFFLKGKKTKASFIKIVELLLYPSNLTNISNNDFSARLFGTRLRDTFIALGPIYIKFGQILSSSPKLVGMEIIEELKFLQDKLPPVEFKQIQYIIEQSFNKQIIDLFLNFDQEPVSAASVSQVHKATMHSGEEVAVKILRPNIHKIYKRDIKFITKFVRSIELLLPKWRRLNLLEVINVLKQVMVQELDLLYEAGSASEIRRNLILDKIVYIPKVVWELSNKNVLTLEWIEGKTIYEIKECDKLERIVLAEKLATIFFYQTFRDGFFHADLHPGNILIMPNGNIALVDFGITSRLVTKERILLAEVLYSFLVNDYLTIAKLHLKAGYIPNNSNLELFAQSCKIVYEKLQSNANDKLSIANLLQDLFKITESFGMKTQPQLVLLQKNMVLVEGVGRILSPNHNMWELARPCITKWARRNLTFEAKIIRVVKELFYSL